MGQSSIIKILGLLNRPAKKPPNGRLFCWLYRSGEADVHCPKLAAVFGVGLRVVCNLLAFLQGFEPIGLDGGKVHKHIVAAVVVGDKAEALRLIEPFYSTVIHNQYLLKDVIQNRAYKNRWRKSK